MREIKFRAWNKDKNIMVYGDEDDTSDYWDGVDRSSVEMVNAVLAHPDEDYIWMQYTGLKDKNGKESFHKDRVKIWLIDYEGNADIFTGVIEWDREDVCWYILNDSNIYPCVKFRFVDYFEIIGNAFENPELTHQVLPLVRQRN